MAQCMKAVAEASVWPLKYSTTKRWTKRVSRSLKMKWNSWRKNVVLVCEREKKLLTYYFSASGLNHTRVVLFLGACMLDNGKIACVTEYLPNGIPLLKSLS